jgi:hypothetical protein
MRTFTDEKVSNRVKSLPTFKGFPKGPMDVRNRSKADEYDLFDDKAFTYECSGDEKRRDLLWLAGARRMPAPPA